MTQFSTEIAAFVNFEKEKMNFHDHLQANYLNIGSKYLAIISVCVDGIRCDSTTLAENSFNDMDLLSLVHATLFSSPLHESFC